MYTNIFNDYRVPLTFINRKESKPFWTNMRACAVQLQRNVIFLSSTASSPQNEAQGCKYRFQIYATKTFKIIYTLCTQSNDFHGNKTKTCVTHYSPIISMPVNHS
jgi:hypothetical protein